MDNPRPEKVAVVEEVKARFSSSDAAVLTEYRGLDVDAMAELRKALRDAGGEYKVYKNTLVRFAADELELEIHDLLTGPTAIAFVTRTPEGEAGDPVNVAKALKTFAKDHPSLVVKGGLLGEKFLAPDEVNALADVAPRDELLARLAAGLAAPMQRFAGLLQAMPRDFAYALRNLIDEGGAPGAPEAEEAPVADAAPEDVPAAGEPASEDEIPRTAEETAPEPPEETEASEAEAPGEPAADEEIPDSAETETASEEGNAAEAAGGAAESTDADAEGEAEDSSAGADEADDD